MSIELLKKIIENPIPFAHSLGYTKLREDLHKGWIKSMLYMKQNGTLQAHRNSFKTTCLIVAIDLWMISRPEDPLIFIRKAENDVKDVLNAVSRDLQSPVCMELMKGIYGKYPKISIDSKTELELSTYNGRMGRQLLGLGSKSSLTGKHGSVFTDDIITLKDRLSAAEREATKSIYRELINIAAEDDMHIFNTGTPWHKDDAFCLMPEPEKWTIYQTGIFSKERIEEIKQETGSPSLFAANYELKHVSDGDKLFTEPQYGKFPIGAEAFAHIDAAYGGADSSALTIIAEVSNKLYTVGWKMPGHIETHYREIISRLERFQARDIYLEDNADKGFLKKELSQRHPARFIGYHEKMNKYYKISTYGRKDWARAIIDMEESDLEYIAEIMDYNENAEHDDCPDSFSSLVRNRFQLKKAVSFGTR